jgi:hypothetical protein
VDLLALPNHERPKSVAEAQSATHFDIGYNQVLNRPLSTGFPRVDTKACPQDE